MIKELIKEAFYPSGIKCIVCDEELSHDTRYGVCDNCKLPFNDNFCTQCGRAVPSQNSVCEQCKREDMPMLAARSSFIFRDGAAALVHKIKYRDAKYLAPVMAEFMLDTFLSANWSVDIVTSVPAHKSRIKTRGYNQSELLAKELSLRIGKDYEALLDKTVKTKSMVGLSKEKRKELIRGTIAIKQGANVAGKTVLLIDDVLTTGSTASECVRILKDNGALGAYVLTFASAELKMPLI